MSNNNEPLRVYWDACVFLSYLQAQPDRIAILDDIWREVGDTNGKIISSVLSMVEVSYANGKEIGDLDALWANPCVEVVELNPVTARRARTILNQSLSDNRKLKVADCIHLATAEWVNQQWRDNIFTFARWPDHPNQ